MGMLTWSKVMNNVIIEGKWRRKRMYVNVCVMACGAGSAVKSLVFILHSRKPKAMKLRDLEITAI